AKSPVRDQTCTGRNRYGIGSAPAGLRIDSVSDQVGLTTPLTSVDADVRGVDSCSVSSIASASEPRSRPRVSGAASAPTRPQAANKMRTTATGHQVPVIAATREAAITGARPPETAEPISLIVVMNVYPCVDPDSSTSQLDSTP